MNIKTISESLNISCAKCLICNKTLTDNMSKSSGADYYYYMCCKINKFLIINGLRFQEVNFNDDNINYIINYIDFKKGITVITTYGDGKKSSVKGYHHFYKLQKLLNFK